MSTHTYTINDRPVSKEEYYSSTEDGVHKIYYKSGALWYETPYVNGKEHGVDKRYYESGALRYEVPYVNGKAHGVYKAYYDTESLQDSGQVSKGDLRSGALRYALPYVNGLLREDLKDNKLAKLVLFGSEE